LLGQEGEVHVCSGDTAAAAKGTAFGMLVLMLMLLLVLVSLRVTLLELMG
jgi:hypothetical protein